MNIRHYKPGDMHALREMYEKQALDYLFPDLESPRFFTRLVLDDDEGKPVMALLGKLTAEMFFLQDPEAGAPRQRLERFLALHQASEREMARAGLDECFAEIPTGERMEKFKRLLGLLGWVPMKEWAPWCKPMLHRRPELPEMFTRLLGENKQITEGG